MSLILEALRKSEAERRRGQAPDLHAELPPAQAARRSRWPAWAWWLPACALVLAAAWLLRPLPSPQSATTTPAAGDAGAAATVTATPGHGRGTRPGVSVDSAAPRFRMPPAATLPARIATPASLPAEDLPATSSPSPSATTPPAIAVAPSSSATTPPAIAVAPSPPTNATPAPPPPDPRPSTATPPASPDAPLQLSDLSAQERKSLPPLKLSMHLWNQDPAKRFVILDGHRVGQGDRVGDAVVAAIIRDGVVLDWNGRRLRLPIR